MEENFIEALLGQYIPDEQDEKRSRDYYPESTVGIISRVGFLIGVPKRVFEDEHSNFDTEVFERLEKEKEARIIRNLSILRTLFERNYKTINNKIMYDMCGIGRMPEIIPTDLLADLRKDGIEMEKANCKTNQYILEINTQIKNHIGNCKGLFPVWLNWNYLRDIFIMPNGEKEQGIREAANHYYGHYNSFPYHLYINWNLADQGNILFNDKKFVSLLYRTHKDEFKDFSRVSDASGKQKADIVDFLLASERVQVVVDCENSDPFKLHAMLNAMREEQTLDRIVKITLYDDVNTSSAWDLLKDFTSIEIEHVELERVLDYKSYLDVSLATGLTRSRYRDGIDSFILFASDSDYWGAIQQIEDARYFIMLESDKVSRATINKFEDMSIPYCYIDDFCTGNAYEFQVRAILREVKERLTTALGGNVHAILEEAVTKTRSNLTENEKKQLYERYIKNMRLVINGQGDLELEFGCR